MNSREYKIMFDIEDKHFWFLGKRMFVEAILKNRLKSNIKILDLGSGTGGMTKYLEKYGDVVGIEKSRYSAIFAKKRGVKILISDIAKIPQKEDKFDLVTLFDVLYHKNVKDEKRVIKEVSRVLKKNGLVLITDSALPILAGRHDTHTQGKTRYTLTQMEKIVKSQNFEIVRSSYIFMSTLPTIAFKRLILDKILKPHTSDVSEVNAVLNYIAKVLIKLESIIFGYVDIPIGSSVIILAQKK